MSSGKFHVVAVRLTDGSKVFNVVGYGKDWNGDNCKITIGTVSPVFADRVAHALNEGVAFVEVDKE